MSLGSVSCFVLLTPSERGLIRNKLGVTAAAVDKGGWSGSAAAKAKI